LTIDERDGGWMRLIIKNFIETELLKAKGYDNLKDTDSLIDSGIIDSLGIQILMPYLERTFSIRINDDEVLPENFETIDAISKFVETKRGSI
jgi:acyl carrier protein